MTNNDAHLYDLLLILCDFPEECDKNMVCRGFRSSKMILNPEIHKHITARKVLVNFKHDDIYYELA